MERYHYFLISVFMLVWVWAAWNPNYRDGWLLENILIFIFAPLFVLVGRYFKLSKISYTFITLFLIMHVVGSHYTYSEVPFGYTLQDWFDSSRNMYDRLVHFSFGFLLVYPVREMFVRVSGARGFWGYYLPVQLISSFAGVFEIFEWQTAIYSSPEAGLAFLGSQGDIWDAQKDMVVAIIGAAIVMFVIFLINVYRDKTQLKSIRQSFNLDTKENDILALGKL